MNKKGFTLIEIVLALIVASIASVYVIQSLMKQDFKEELVNLQDNVQYLIENGIVSPMGYASGGGGECSTSLDYNGLTTTRLFNCLQIGDGWRDLNLTSNLSPFIVDRNYMQSYGGFDTTTGLTTMGCGIRVSVGANNNDFFVLVDCSRVAPLALSEQDDTDRRRLKQIEEAVEFVFSRKLEHLFVSSRREVTLVTGLGDGNDEDGIVWGHFRY